MVFNRNLYLRIPVLLYTNSNEHDYWRKAFDIFVSPVQSLHHWRNKTMSPHIDPVRMDGMDWGGWKRACIIELNRHIKPIYKRENSSYQFNTIFWKCAMFMSYYDTAWYNWDNVHIAKDLISLFGFVILRCVWVWVCGCASVSAVGIHYLCHLTIQLNQMEHIEASKRHHILINSAHHFNSSHRCE